MTVPLRSEEQLDREAEKLVVDIQQAAWENSSEIKTRTKGNNHPTEIRDQMTEKRKARRRWHQTRNPKDKNELNNLAQQLKREIKELKSDTIRDCQRKLTNDNSADYSFWKATKNLVGLSCRSPPIRKHMEDGPETVNQKPSDLHNT